MVSEHSLSSPAAVADDETVIGDDQQGNLAGAGPELLSEIASPIVRQNACACAQIAASFLGEPRHLPFDYPYRLRAARPGPWLGVHTAGERRPEAWRVLGANALGRHGLGRATILIWPGCLAVLSVHARVQRRVRLGHPKRATSTSS